MSKEIPHSGINHNVIAQGTKVVGTIITETDIRIDGELEGDVTSKGKIIVGQQGSIQGTIKCNNAEILGHINGKIEIIDTLSLKSTAKVTGDIKTKILSIEPEAVFSGSCDMSNQTSKNQK